MIRDISAASQAEATRGSSKAVAWSGVSGVTMTDVSTGGPNFSHSHTHKVRRQHALACPFVYKRWLGCCSYAVACFEAQGAST